MFSNENTYYIDLLKYLSKYGLSVSPRQQDVKEAIGVGLEVFNNKTLISLPGIRDASDPNTREGKYLRAEFVWYMSGDMRPNFIGKYASLWNKITNNIDIAEEKYKDINEYVNSNYGYQVFHKIATLPWWISKEAPVSMFEWVCNELKKDRDSRKAIIQYTIPHIIYNNGVRDFTCTQNQHFMIRTNKLINIVHIRSSDAIKGLTFDIPWWDIVGQLVANELDCDYLDLMVNINSSHYYDSDKKLVCDIINNEDKCRMKSLKLHNPKDKENNRSKLLDIYDEMCKYYLEKCNGNNHYIIGTYDVENANNIGLLKMICLLHESMSIILDDEKIPNERIDEFNNKIFDTVLDYGG